MIDMTTIFFDWDGVIAGAPDNGHLISLLTNSGASKQLAQRILRHGYAALYAGRDCRTELWDELRTTYGLAIPDTISDEFKKHGNLVLNEDVMVLARAAKNKGLQIAVLTNVIEPAYVVLSEGGYYDGFGQVIASCKVGFAKPQEEIYHLTLERIYTTAGKSPFY